MYENYEVILIIIDFLNSLFSYRWYLYNFEFFLFIRIDKNETSIIRWYLFMAQITKDVLKMTAESYFWTRNGVKEIRL